MWASRYWADRYWAPRYWAKHGATNPVVPGPYCEVARDQFCPGTREAQQFAPSNPSMSYLAGGPTEMYDAGTRKDDSCG